MPARPIDLATWPRRDHFRLFKALDHPYFSVTVALDVTAWMAAIKAAGLPFYPAMIHRVSAAANAVEAFRLRIRGEGVVVHDVVHPSFTVPWRDELFNFCTVDFHAELDAFLAGCLPAIAASESASALMLDEVHRDDMIFLSCLPWLAFTGVTQVGDAKSGDSYPRIAWGKVTEQSGRLMVPLSLQLHHALADGRHMAAFVSALEAGMAEQVEGLRSTRR
jgi:chloramphenicol O-acetyltransferase